MYDEISLASDREDDRWMDDHAALLEAWRNDGVCSVPIIRFSTMADAAGHFFFESGPLAGGLYYLVRRAFDALNVWLQGRAGRKVHLRLADGTEMSAATSAELAKIADIVGRLRPDGQSPTDAAGSAGRQDESAS